MMDYYDKLTVSERVLISDFKQAMDQGVPVAVNYDGLDKIIEIHAIGISRSGNPVIRAYQVAGESKSGEVPGWKMMLISKMSFYAFLLHNSSITYGAPRPGYVKGDRGMVHIFKEL